MLPIDLSGKRAFVAGVSDDRGYGWAIVRALARAGASVCVGTWPPTLRILTKSLERGKLDMSLPGGGEILRRRQQPSHDQHQAARAERVRLFDGAAIVVEPVLGRGEEAAAA